MFLRFPPARGAGLPALGLWLVIASAVADDSLPVRAELASANTANVDLYNLSLEELSQIQVSIATGNNTPLGKAPAVASVVYAAEIEAMGARNLDEVLETLPGLHVSLSSLSRLDSVYSIRGIHTGFNPQVLLLLDGVPVQFSVQSGRPTLFRLPVTSIERVEIIRGPGSAVYGADAYAGVINVITKDARSIASTSVGMRTGSFNSRDAWLQTAGDWQGLGLALTMTYQSTDGDNSRRVNSDQQTILDSVLGTHASLAPGALSTGYEILDTHLSITGDSFRANLWNWQSRDAGEGAGGAQALDPWGHDDSRLTRGDLNIDLFKSGWWDNSLRLSYMDYHIQTHFKLFPDGAVLPVGSDGNLDFATPAGIVSFPDGLFGNPGGHATDGQLEFISTYTGWDSHRLRLATGARRQAMSASETKNFGPGVIDGSQPVVTGKLVDLTGTEGIYMDDQARRLGYFSLQDEWQMLENLEFTAGLRYDRYSDFGGTTNPRLALVWSATDNLTAKLLYGSAFRAPSFAELYLKNNPVSLGNPELVPEKIDTREASVNYRLGELETTLTAFTYKARDMIDFVLDANTTTKTAQNVRDQDGRGYELEVLWKPAASLHLSASYSRQWSEDSHSGATIPDAPGEQFKANLTWLPATDWSLAAQLAAIGKRARSTSDARASIADYTRLNLNLTRKNLAPGLDLSLAMRNAANTDEREPSTGAIAEDYPLESRSYWLGLTYNFH